MKADLPQARARRPFRVIWFFFIDHMFSFNLFVNLIVVMCSIDKQLIFAPKSNFLCFYLELQFGFILKGGFFAPGYPTRNPFFFQYGTKTLLKWKHILVKKYSITSLNNITFRVVVKLM